MIKIIKRILAAILAVLAFLAIGAALKYLLYDDTDSYGRIVFHDLQHEEENVDVLFVGSSHCRRSIDPLIADEMLGQNTFNLSTLGQRIDGSYAVIQEACSSNKVSRIYLELYYGVVDDGAFADRTLMTATYLVSDFMKPSLYKLKFLLRASSPEYYATSFLLPRRNAEDLLDPEYLADLYRKKHDPVYLEYQIESENEDYVSKGFFATDNTYYTLPYWTILGYGPIYILDSMTSESDWRNTLLEIVSYCRKHEIELVFFTAPEQMVTIAGSGNYQAFHDAVQQIADQCQIKYYDFNFIRETYFNMNDRALFQDEDHLNRAGADQFTTLFCQLINGEIKAEDLFYDSLEDKYQASPAMVYGAAGPKKRDDGN